MHNSIIVLAAEFLKGFALGLGDEKRSKASQQHEEGVNLQDVVHPGVCIVLGGASGAEGGNGTLADDGTDLAGRGGYAV